MTDWERVVKWFREHPGSSVQEVRFGLFISNVTGRMSDARAHGFEFHKWRDDKGIFRYSVEEPGQRTLGLVG
jgi:hypothetical protein